MAIAHQGTTTFTGASATSVATTIPAAATTGRLILLVFMQSNTGSPTITLPSGFTSHAQFNTATTVGGVVVIAYKIAGAGDAGAAATISSTATATWTGQYSIYSGVNATTPLIATATQNASTMSSTTLTAPAVTAANANSMMFCFYSGATGNTPPTYTPQVSMTERSDFTRSGSANTALGSAEELVAAAGSTGTRAITASISTTGAFECSTAMNEAAVATATLTQTTFRGRNDDGSETTATWKATAGTDWTQLVDTNFRVRFNISDSVAAATQNTAFILRYSLNGGAYTAVSASSSVVRAFASANVTDGAATTEQLAGSGTFNAGTFDEVDGSATGFTAATSTGQDTEVEYSLQIRGVDVADADTINLRIYDNAGAALNGGYTDTPIITVSKPAASLIFEPVSSLTRTLRSM